MECNIRVLSCGSNGTGNASIVSLIAKAKYSQELSVVASCLLNCGDSTQKICGEQKIKLNTISCIVLQSLAPHNVSGLPGMLLSLSSLGLAEVTVIGPSGVASLLHYMAPFTNRKYPEVRIKELASTEVCEVKLQHFTLLCRGILASPTLSSSVGVACVVTSPHMFQPLAMGIPVATSFTSHPSHSSLLAWAAELGTKLVLCCALQYGVLHVENGVFDDFVEEVEDYDMTCVAITGKYHRRHCEFVYPHIFLTLMQYSAVFNLFPRSVFQPTISDLQCADSDEDSSISYKPMDAQTILSAEPLICFQFKNDESGMRISQPEHYEDYVLRKCLKNIRRYNTTPAIPKTELTTTEVLKAREAGEVVPVSCNSSSARNLREQLRLKRKRNETEATVENAATTLHSTGTSYFSSIKVPPPSPLDAIITFLGTGCAAPSKYRSNSAIVLQTKGDVDAVCCVLIDAGESVFAQMCQSYSDIERLHDMLRSLRVVWISHHHADHHCGLPMLVEYVSSLALHGTKLLVVAPESVIKYQEFLLCASGLDHLVDFVDISTTVRRRGGLNLRSFTGGCVNSLMSVPVKHCHQSYGVVLFSSRHGKIVYSGDCRPSDSLICEGINCDLLIHEATFDDSLHEDAVCKKHSTTSEAVDVATRMHAKHLILTHFSQRYPKSPVSEKLNEAEQPFQYSVAYDFLRFAFPSQINILPEATCYVSDLFGKQDSLSGDV